MRQLSLAFALLLPFGVLWMNCQLRRQGMPRHLIVAFLAVDLVLFAQYMSRREIRLKLLVLLYSSIFIYTLFEISYSCYSAVINARTFHVFEEPVNLEYDPVMGYKYAGRPARWSLVISDVIQWSSTLE